MNKLHIAIIFGGKSAEHEVSIASAKNVYSALDKDKYNPLLVYIKKDGEWVVSSDLQDFVMDGKEIDEKNNTYVTFAPKSEGFLLDINNGQKKHKIDVAFPILHGTFGEDGTIQGLLKLAEVPFVGASVLGSAIGMDKSIMKKLLRDAKIPIAKFITVDSDSKMPEYDYLIAELGTPFFVKPSNMGSSVGVHKVWDKEGYDKAMKDAFLYDFTVIIEEYVDGREIECSVLGNSNPASSALGEVIPSHEFYSYNAKYIDEMGAKLVIPVKLEKEIEKKIQKLAVDVFLALHCEGFARVDFFLKEGGEVVVNEINTIPGFTKISMYPKLWKESGLSYKDLVSKLIDLALERHNKEEKLKTTYL